MLFAETEHELKLNISVCTAVCEARNLRVGAEKNKVVVLERGQVTVSRIRSWR